MNWFKKAWMYITGESAKNEVTTTVTVTPTTNIKFFFWNTQGKSFGTLKPVFDAALLDVDVLCIAESAISNDTLDKEYGFKFIHETHRRSRKKIVKTLRIYSKQTNLYLTPLGEFGNGEAVATTLKIANKKVIVIGVHLMSRLTYKSEERRFQNSMDFRDAIEGFEKQNLDSIGTIVFGDFNMNPYEKGFSAFNSLFAIDLLVPPPQRLSNVPYFVNATASQVGHFNHFSDARKKPAGSYYHGSKNLRDHEELFWNCLDGLIFRPGLTSQYLQGKPLELLTQISPTISLYNFNTHSINNHYSDHLPLTFTFKF